MEEPTRPELERFFFLDDEDRKLIAKRRGDHNRLGFALQMCTVRYIGLFLEDPLAVPWPVMEHLAAQLEIEDVSYVRAWPEQCRPAGSGNELKAVEGARRAAYRLLLPAAPERLASHVLWPA